MQKYVIVAESGSDIPRELAEKHNIYIVPMHVTFGDVTKKMGIFRRLKCACIMNAPAWCR